MQYFNCKIIIEPKARLTWPYGDKVPGAYIGKFSLPLFCILMAIAVSKKAASIISGIIGLLSIGISVITTLKELISDKGLWWYFG